MQRVVITGMGLVSCLGQDRASVIHSLKNGLSGITANSSYAQLNLKSQISGTPSVDLSSVDRKLKRFMGDGASFAYISALSAIADAGLTLDYVACNPRIGVVAGSGGASTTAVVETADAVREHGARRVAPTMVPKSMTSTVTAALATGLKIHGVSYAISSACATSAHCIGHAMELIQLGKQDIVLAGGGEEEHWSQSVMFDAMGATSSQYNASPTTASRPYSVDRDGFVIAGGGGVVVVESLEHALARNATILAEIVGYGATSDGSDMVAPSGEGATRCMQMALKQAENVGITTIDYINTHGTSTPVGDTAELLAIKAAFAGAATIPPISSTKSMSGHSLGAAGVHEAIYCMLMMQESFIAPSINITQLDPIAQSFDIVQQTRDTPVTTAMSNSFGFGGTNATIILTRWQA